MKKTFRPRKSAFSLIELSIVLIIIGLLIAGVTGGASLVRSAELRAVVGEARGYAVAVNSFYTQYNDYPGDYATVIGNGVAGDGDATIEYYGDGTNASESANAWIVLRTIGAIDTITSTSAPTAATTSPTWGTTAPASKIKSSGWAFDYRNNDAAPYTNESSSQNVVVLTGTIGTGVTADDTTLVNTSTGVNVATAAIYATDALSIDTKVDDGDPGAGAVRGVNPGYTAGTLATAAATSSSTVCYYYASSTFTYNTTDTTKSCAISYQVDISSSD